jgi:hypothetical protein
VLFLIDVKAGGGGWEVRLQDDNGPVPGADGQPVVRRLRGVEKDGQLFPLPPQEEAQALDVQAFHYSLCQAATCPDELSAIYERLVNRLPRSTTRDVERFGCYLFATLLGNKLWDVLKERAGTEVLELALKWEKEERAFHRLPWEMMHGPDGFLIEQQKPLVLVTRRVAVPGQAEQKITLTSPPRVLFVVGSDLDSDVIRPGAEFMGLVRGLEAGGLNLLTHLLLQATVKKLKKAIAEFRPTVVHFICHGGLTADGKGFIEFMDDDSTRPARVEGAALAQLLRPDPDRPLPEIVVLNACSSGSILNLGDVGQVASPLAVELVEKGVPIVVGMAGEVADQACRLFSRLFYESLLRDGQVALAASQGRRLGIIGEGRSDPRITIDWALPTLVLPAAVKNICLKEVPQEWQVRKARADNYRCRDKYPIFCDRLESLRWYSVLMADLPSQKELSPRKRSFQVLGMAAAANRVDPAGRQGFRAGLATVRPSRSSDSLVPPPRFGRSWVLHRFATQAVLDGHIPCLVNKEVLGDPPPKTLPELTEAIVRAGNKTAEWFDVLNKWEWRHVQALGDLKPNDSLPAWFPEIVRRNHKKAEPFYPPTVAAAIRIDLLALRKAVCPAPEPEQTGQPGPASARDRAGRVRLLLLIDDVHRMGEAANQLLKFLLGKDGLQHRDAAEEARAAFAYAATPKQGEVSALKWIQNAMGEEGMEEVPLDCFTAPEDRLAYKQFLLHWRVGNQPDGNLMGLTLPSGADQEDLDFFFGFLDDAVQGIPSNLTESGEVERVIRKFLEAPKKYNVRLSIATDEDKLRS